MHIKLNKLSWTKKLTKYTKIWSPRNKQIYPTVQTVTDNTVNTNIPYNWPDFVAVDNVITSLYALIGIRYYGSHSNA